MAKTYRLDLFIRPASTVSEEYALTYALNWANSRTDQTDNQENGEPINAYYIDVTDLRNGKKFMVFGDVAHGIISGGTEMDQKQTMFDPTKYLQGYSEDIVIGSVNGRESVNVDNPDGKNITVIPTVKDSLQAEIRVENESNTGFDLVLYDSEAFVEDEATIDCSIDPIVVNQTVIFI
jgi:hypothetical protein